MSETPELKLIVEAALLAADEPLTVNRIQQLFQDPENKDQALPEKTLIKEALAELTEDYANRGVECIELASGYTLRVKQDFAPWVTRLWELKPARYTRAFLETLVLIAYKQPLTRSEIEEVRGVAVSSHIIKGLLEREWIKVVGHRDVPGKPAVLATTKTFLDYFNLKSLEDLPTLQDIVDLDKAGDQLEMQLQQAMADAEVSSDREPTADTEDTNTEEMDSSNEVKQEAISDESQENLTQTETEIDTDTDTEFEFKPEPIHDEAVEETVDDELMDEVISEDESNVVSMVEAKEKLAETEQKSIKESESHA